MTNEQTPYGRLKNIVQNFTLEAWRIIDETEKRDDNTMKELLLQFGSLTTKDEQKLNTQKIERSIDMSYLKEGTLFKRKDGRWEAKLMVNGKQKSIACCRKKEDAYNKIKKAVELKRKNKLEIIDKKQEWFTIHSWIDFFWKTYMFSGEKLEQSTKKRYEGFIAHFKKAMQDKMLYKLDMMSVEMYFLSFTDGRDKEMRIVFFKRCFKKAHGLGKTKVNLMENVNKPKYDKKTGRNLLQDEIDRITGVCETQEKLDLIGFYLNTGCRFSELLRVENEHINLSNEKKVITNLYWKKKKQPDITLRPNEIFIYGTKNPTSIRTMPIFNPLRPILQRRMALVSKYLFPMSKASLRRIFEGVYTRGKYIEGIMAKSNVNFTVKDFRHTCATKCKDLGFPVEVYHPWFGWADETMAKKVYAVHKTEADSIKAHEWASKFE